MAERLFRPANSTHGEIFCMQFCYSCKYWQGDDNFDHLGKPYCKLEIYDNTLIYDVTDPEYPKEWRFGEDGNPVCIAYKRRIPPEPVLEEDGYPTHQQLRAIRWWPWDNLEGLAEYVCKLWKYPNMARFNRATGLLVLHTGGWSGNEQIVEALQYHPIFWKRCWLMSKRGGHYWFTIEKRNRKKKQKS